MAKKQIKRMHRKVKVIKAFADARGWRVTKNALGVPEFRDNSGYVLFQLRGEKWCQLRYFRVTEKYVGRRFKKASSATIGFVRFQSCK